MIVRWVDCGSFTWDHPMERSAPRASAKDGYRGDAGTRGIVRIMDHPEDRSVPEAAITKGHDLSMNPCHLSLSIFVREPGSGFAADVAPGPTQYNPATMGRTCRAFEQGRTHPTGPPGSVAEARRAVSATQLRSRTRSRERVNSNATSRQHLQTCEIRIQPYVVRHGLLLCLSTVVVWRKTS